MTLAGAGRVYLALGFVLWVHAWAPGRHAPTRCAVAATPRCSCGSSSGRPPRWPTGTTPSSPPRCSTPAASTCWRRPRCTGLSLPLVPVTWIWGPVASLNVASTLAPALTAFTAFVVIRRWAPWTPAAFVGGLLYGFSPFVLTSLEFAHLMTAALMLLAAHPRRPRRDPDPPAPQRALVGRPARACSSSRQFFLSTELLAIVAVVVVVVHRRRWWPPRLVRPGRSCGGGPPMPPGHWASASPSGSCSSPGRCGSRSPARRTSRGWSGPTSAAIGGFLAVELRDVGRTTAAATASILALGGYEGTPLALVGLSRLEPSLPSSSPAAVAFWRDRRLWFFGFVLAALRRVLARRAQRGSGSPPGSSTSIPVLENVIEQRFMAVGFLAAAVHAGPHPRPRPRAVRRTGAAGSARSR